MPIEALLVTATAWGLGALAIWFTFISCRNLIVPIDQGVRKVSTVAVLLTGWLFFTGLLGAYNKLGDFSPMPPPFMIFMVCTFILTFALAFSPIGTLWMRGLGFPILIGFQMFRILAELVLYFGWRNGVFPIQMTFEGYNFDIVTGVTALPMALLLSRYPSKKLALLWNIGGLVLLLVIVVIAITSTPSAMRLFHNEPANTIVTTFPLIWLPTVLVPFALLGHLLCFRRLAQ